MGRRSDPGSVPPPAPPRPPGRSLLTRLSGQLGCNQQPGRAGRRLPLARMAPRASADLAAVAGLCALGCLTLWQLLRDGTVIGMDTATAFYPWYAYLGESLRSGHIPMWNPHQFAGTPFAADPESGWTYLPAMLLFTLLPLTYGGQRVPALSRPAGQSGDLRPGPQPADAAHRRARQRRRLQLFRLLLRPQRRAASPIRASPPGSQLPCSASTEPSSATGDSASRWWALGGLAISQILATWLGPGCVLRAALPRRVRCVPDPEQLTRSPGLACQSPGAPRLHAACHRLRPRGDRVSCRVSNTTRSRICPAATPRRASPRRPRPSPTGASSRTGARAC